MSKSLPQILPTDRPFWFCLRAQTKREHFAAIGLRKQYQITCFAPRLRMRKLTKRGAVWFVEAMFPGYFFGQFDYVTERRRVEHAPGVRGLLQFGDRLATIDSATIDALRQRMEAEELVTLDPEIKVGQEVQIAHGPLQGLEVLVTQLLPASERVRVLLEFLVALPANGSVEGNFNSTAGGGGFLVTIGNRRLLGPLGPDLELSGPAPRYRPISRSSAALGFVRITCRPCSVS